MDESLSKLLGSVAKPVEKLIDRISDATGVIYQPTHLVRMAKAKAKADLINSKSRFEINEIEDRAKLRVESIELRRQFNIESIISRVIPKIRETDVIQEITDDWIINYFEHCKDINDEKLQQLWAEVLAGESIKPGSYSIRTLSFLKYISPSDAVLFSKIVDFVMLIEGIPCLLWDLGAKRYYNEHGFKVSELHSLRQAGFLTIQEDYRLYREKKRHQIQYFKKNIVIDTTHHGESTIPILLLSHEAEDLLSLTEGSYHEDFLGILLNKLRHKKNIAIYVDGDRFYKHDPSQKYALEHK